MTRYRCTSCGNLTRFDVTATRTVKAFHHYTVGGGLATGKLRIDVAVDYSPDAGTDALLSGVLYF